MDNNKIAFITCVNDKLLYEENLRYINSLNVPEGYEIEVISIMEAENMTAAYNAVMNSIDAKYKVYLHQDTFIINKDFISNILAIFKNKEIGMIGMVGASKIPTNGIWWEAKEKYGKVYENHTGIMQQLSFSEMDTVYKEVQGIDGFIMITQYDLPWREDIFNGWHFYDISQSIEFILKGYKVIVPNQVNPWCVHDCGLVNTSNGYDKYREEFLKEYSNDIFPLVSILIPTYNRPDFFTIALESALNQTYKNIEIIIGDDSTNHETQKIIKNYQCKYKNITYIKNEKPLGELGLNNLNNLYSLSRGEYINILNDDDVFEVNKIEKMVNYFIENKEIEIVTSYRELIDENSNKINDKIFNQKICSRNTLFEGEYLGNSMIETFINFIGEPTTTMFKRNRVNKKFGTFLSREYKCLVDMAQWLECLRYGKGVYLVDKLSSFRIHSNQNTNNTYLNIQGLIEKYYLINDSYKNNVYIKSQNEYLRKLFDWVKIVINFISFEESLKSDKKFDINQYDLLLKLKKQAMDIISKNINNKNGTQLTIVDDYFPNVKTGFRVAEFNYYLDKYKDIEIYSDTVEYENWLKDYSKQYIKNVNKIKKYANLSLEALERTKIFYSIFVSNTYKYLELFEMAKKPFVFTLYPGGCFGINESENSDEKLKRIFESKYFHKVIVTQKVTYEYLLNKNLVEKDKIEFIYGCVTFKNEVDSLQNKLFYNKDKDTMDICFVANKYMDKGIDKGYDTFIKVCKNINKINKNIYFHIVGNFNEKDIDISDISKNIRFYGTRDNTFFKQFYRNKDIIISPNIPFVLKPGSFDGFPLTCSIDAALNKTLPMCSDVLNENREFKDGENICIITKDVNEIVNKILYYFETPSELYKIAEAAKNKFEYIYNIDNQMKNRIKLFKEFEIL